MLKTKNNKLKNNKNKESSDKNKVSSNKNKLLYTKNKILHIKNKVSSDKNKILYNKDKVLYNKNKKLNKKLKNILYKKRKLIILLTLVLFIAIIFFETLKMGLILGFLLLLNIGISYFSRSIPRYNTALELIMFSTVLSSVSYGYRVGSLVGIIFSISYYFAVGRMSLYVLIFAPLYAVFGFVAGILPYQNIVTLGMICVITYSIISSILVGVFFKGHFDKMLGFIFINTLFNLIIFKYLAPIFLILMG